MNKTKIILLNSDGWIKIGNPIGFNSSVISKFKKIKGDVGTKFMVKRLKNETKFIKVKILKSFKDFDKVSDFRT